MTTFCYHRFLYCVRLLAPWAENHFTSIGLGNPRCASNPNRTGTPLTYVSAFKTTFSLIKSLFLRGQCTDGRSVSDFGSLTLFLFVSLKCIYHIFFFYSESLQQSKPRKWPSKRKNGLDSAPGIVWRWNRVVGGCILSSANSFSANYIWTSFHRKSLQSFTSSPCYDLTSVVGTYFFCSIILKPEVSFALFA